MRWGYSVPFDDDLLKSLYRTNGQYVSRVVKVNERNVENGYILEPDAEIDNQVAAQSSVGK